MVELIFLPFAFIMNNKSVNVSPVRTSRTGVPNDKNKQEQISKEQTEKYLLYTLIGSLTVLLCMLIYVINEYYAVSNASPEYLETHYNFGTHQSFYLESSDAYLKFILRFITIYGLISVFGIFSMIFRKPWLYLLIIVMALISVTYFFFL